jgi:hypothetical protein
MSPLNVRPRRGKGIRLLLLAAWGLLLLAPLSCNKSSSSSSSGSTPARSLSASRVRARQVNNYLMSYGPWDSASIAIAKNYDVVVVHPSQGVLTRDIVRQIQQGNDPNDPSDDVVVLGYISIGEDLRTIRYSDEQMRNDPRFAGDGSGPRVDPRGHLPDGGPLDGIDPLGDPSPGGTGFASWYLDDNSVDQLGHGDGLPDRTARFGACFVNAGDPKWFDAVNSMTLDGPDRLAGLREIMSLDYGRGLGCDGVFLDTFDTCGPNRFTNASSPNQSEFEWTAPGFSSFVARLRSVYPDHVVLQNRGLFFFDSRHPHYQFTTRSMVDLVLFESLRLNSNPAEGINLYFSNDNRYNIAPKLMAEANRPDGFRVVSLGYAEGPPGQMSTATLVGGSTLGMDLLLEDIRIAEQENGFRHYLSNAFVTLVNDFVRLHAQRDDHAPPVWSSTYNANTNSVAPAPPTPRPGLQEMVGGPGSLTVRWDVALDLNPVQYALYLQTRPFDFAADPNLTQARRIVLTPEIGAGYAAGPGPSTFPYEATVSGLAPGQGYYGVIRAFDTSPAANEEKNQVVQSAMPQ